jgi:hypothetical protein
MHSLYFLKLVGETALALGGLAACGGWAVFLFPGNNRPLRWLAAPQAGLATLALLLVGFYFGCRLPFWAAGSLALVLPLSLTAYLAWKRGLARPGLAPLAAGLLTAVTSWSTYVNNRASVESSGPALLISFGSDMIAYAQAADWVVRHPPSEQAVWDLERPYEVFVSANLYHEVSRPAAFLLLGLASWVRDTTALFSYDWLCGVALASGVLALVGCYASNRRDALLLVAAGCICAWLPVARTGYLGKLLAYPGCMLLAAVVYETWQGGGVARLLGAITLGVGTALSLNPSVPPAVIGGLFAVWFPCVVVRCLASRSWRIEPNGRHVLAHLAWGAGVFVLATLPFVAWHHIALGRNTFGVPNYPYVAWDWVFPSALDVESCLMWGVGQERAGHLLMAALALQLVLVVVAIARQRGQALGYLLSALVLAVGWCLNDRTVFAYHGLLFPLAIIGAVLAGQGPALRGPRWLLPTTTFLLAAGLIGVRAPQAVFSHRLLVRTPTSSFIVYRDRDVRQLRALLGTEPVDVYACGCQDAGLAIGELALLGAQVQLREAGWRATMSIVHHSAKVPNWEQGRYRLSIAGSNWSPPEQIRFLAGRLQLSEDRGGLAITNLACGPGHFAWTPAGKLFWVGNNPVDIELWNGTGRTVPVVLAAESAIGPANPDLTRRTLACECAGQKCEQELNNTHGWQVRLSFDLPPGAHTARVWFSAPVASPGDDFTRGLLLQLLNYRLERRPPEQRPASLNSGGSEGN